MNRLPTALVFSAITLLVGGTVVTVRSVARSRVRTVLSPVTPSVLGQTSLPGQTHFDTLTTLTGTPLSSASPRPSPTPSSTPTPTPPSYAVTIIDGPGDLMEGEIATFTWHVAGPAISIPSTAVYYGTTSHPGPIPTDTRPEDTPYREVIKDFLSGTYGIPLRFVGSTAVGTPGTYFYRAYATIGSKHYWSGERNFVVKALPRHEINVLHYPSVVSAGGNAAFTWEIFGPAATTGFTAIAGGKQSLPGGLDASVDLPKTPYAVLTPDFTNGAYGVPLRFIGNVRVGEPGVYYFRALSFINGKNIWSDEYSFTVQ